MSQKKHNQDVELDGEENANEPEIDKETIENNKGSDQIKELNDKYLRLYSDFENFRRRTQKEKLDIIQNANEDLLVNLLPVYDDFERALNNMDKNPDVEAAIEGIKLIFNKFQKVLNQTGLEEIKTIGLDFDPDVEEAIAKIPADPSKKGKVIDEAQKGFKLNDKIIRHAKVVVGE